MKIGAFARNNEVTIDTIRHYMDLGLVVPLKVGAHYTFDEGCQKDLDHLFKLKEMGFQLKDIQRIFAMIRMGAATPKQEVAYIIHQFQNRIREIEEAEHELAQKKECVALKMEELKRLDFESESFFGIQLKHLDVFYCNACDRPYEAVDASVQQGVIVDGRLECSCGKELLIENGIVIGETHFTQRHNKMMMDAEKMYEDYVASTDPSFLDHLYATMEWMRKRIDFENAPPTVFLELGIGAGMFLRHVLDHLREDDLYIGIDHDLERLELLRDVYMAMGLKKPILLICSDFLEMPLKKHLADTILDLSGSLHYAFDHKKPLIPLVDKWFGTNAQFLGAYLVFDHLYHHLESGIQCEALFKIQGINTMLEESHFKCLEAIEGPVVKAGGKYERMHQAGKNMRGYRYYGKRDLP